MYPSDITYHFTTGTLILQVSSTFYKPYQRITTVNMKNSKAKDGPRSLQMPSSHIYLTYPAFHIEISPLITSRECVGAEGPRNKCMSNTATWPADRLSATGSIRRASHHFPRHRWEFSFGFRANLAERVVPFTWPDHHPLYWGNFVNSVGENDQHE